MRPFDMKTIGMGKIITNKTPFRPFHKDTTGTLWTPDDARDWFKLGYTYPELKRWEYGPDQGQVRATLLEYINNTYGVTRRQALLIAKSDEQVSGVISTGKDSVAIKDYAVSIRYSKYYTYQLSSKQSRANPARFAMGGNPFNLEVYLLPKGVTEKTFEPKHFVTSVYNFSQPAKQNGETVCDNCSELEGEDVQVTSYIPLTSYLIRMIQQRQLESLDPVVVEDLLKGVYWRMTMVFSSFCSLLLAS